eukprot:1191345-Prorocentrum_minimum.AAC.2
MQFRSASSRFAQLRRKEPPAPTSMNPSHCKSRAPATYRPLFPLVSLSGGFWQISPSRYTKTEFERFTSAGKLRALGLKH